MMDRDGKIETGLKLLISPIMSPLKMIYILVSLHLVDTRLYGCLVFILQ